MADQNPTTSLWTVYRGAVVHCKEDVHTLQVLECALLVVHAPSGRIVCLAPHPGASLPLSGAIVTSTSSSAIHTVPMSSSPSLSESEWNSSILSACEHQTLLTELKAFCEIVSLSDGVKAAQQDAREWLSSVSVRSTDKENIASELESIPAVQIVTVPRGCFLVPGFIDTHVHAPQYQNAGLGTDLPLLPWLEKYTFPVEKQFADIEYARPRYEKFVQHVLRNGTTCAVAFATIHTEATNLLADICHHRGLRCFVGKVNMNTNSKDYVETTEESMSSTRAVLAHIRSLNDDIVQPIVTPRFAPSCTADLLNRLGKLAAEENLPIQSHINENKDEIKWVAELFPGSKSYTDVYEQSGLLTERTIMAHGCHCTAAEHELFLSRKAGISHCPNSNFTLNSGILGVRALWEKGIKVGLGTDGSGGYSFSMLNSIRNAIIASSALNIQDPSVTSITYVEAFGLATLGGADLVCMRDELGNFATGKFFDALLVNPKVDHSPFDVFPGDSVGTLFQRFLFNGDDRNIQHVYVKGRKVK